MGRLNGKVCLVTGAASGIGKAIATLFTAEAGVVFLSDINAQVGRDVASTLSRKSQESRFIEHDVSSEASWRQVLEQIFNLTDRLDVIVNNAGIHISKSLDLTTFSDWKLVQAVNADGVFLGTKFGVEAMEKHNLEKRGSIVNISSTWGLVGDPMNSAYCGSKGAVTNFTKSAALHCAEKANGIRINSIHPGVIRTPMVERETRDLTAMRGLDSIDTVLEETRKICPLGIGEPEDIAYGALYLACDESKFVTGSQLVIDGGQLAR